MEKTNSFENEYFQEEMDMDKLPNFILRIIYDVNIKDGEILKFFKKFGFEYLRDEEFRNKTDGYEFLFLNGKYIGTSKNVNTLYDNNFYYKYVFIISMYPTVRIELHEEENIDYSDINSVEKIQAENFQNGEAVDIDILPNFMNSIVYTSCICNEGKVNFFAKFCYRYLKCKKFRRLTDGYTFLFMDGKYIGTFKTEREGELFARKLNCRDIFTVAMYPEIHYEFS